MIVLIIGTPDSGKSRKAEDMLLELSGNFEKIYIATMIPFGEEGKDRVAKHRKMRKGKGFVTVECPQNVDKLIYEIENISDKNCLLECMSNLVGNELYAEENSNLKDEDLAFKIDNEVIKLGKSSRNLVIVSNRFNEDDPDFDEETKRYVALTNRVNELLKEKADQIYELEKGEWIFSENN